mgnify:CR=1 FL=1
METTIEGTSVATKIRITDGPQMLERHCGGWSGVDGTKKTDKITRTVPVTQLARIEKAESSGVRKLCYYFCQWETTIGGTSATTKIRITDGARTPERHCRRAESRKWDKGR